MNHSVVWRLVESLRGVVAVAALKLQALAILVLFTEALPGLAIVVADLVGGSRIRDDPLQVLRITVEGDGIHVDALGRFFGDVEEGLPMDQVGGAPEADDVVGAAQLHDELIRFGLGVVEHARITLAWIKAVHMVDKRLSAVDHGPGAPLVGAVGPHLEKRPLFLGRLGIRNRRGMRGGEEGEERLHVPLLLAEGVDFVHHGRARPDRVLVPLRILDVGVGIENVRQLRPVEEIRTHRLPPGFGPACVPLGVVLEGLKPLPVVVDHPVGVVEPTDPRGEVELGTQRLIVTDARIHGERVVVGGVYPFPLRL